MAGAKQKTVEDLPEQTKFRKAQVARILKISRPTVDRMVQDGRLQAEIIGGVTFVKVPE